MPVAPNGITLSGNLKAMGQTLDSGSSRSIPQTDQLATLLSEKMSQGF